MKTKSNQDSKLAVRAKLVADIRSDLATLRAMLARAEAKSDGDLDWCTLGDLGYVASQLHDIATSTHTVSA